MKIAIFGAGGFIGSHIVEHLLDRGEHEILGIDKDDAKLAGIEGPAFTFYRADATTDSDLAESLIEEADVVVDLMAYASPSLYVNQPLDVVELNYEQNVRVVRSCVRQGTRLIQYSSSEVYGKADRSAPAEEDVSDFVQGPVHLQRWIYAVAKQLLERVVYAHGERDGLDFTIVRPFNFIGPRFDYLVEAGATGGPRVFAHFVSALRTGGPMYLVNGGTQHRAFTHISDATTAFQTILDHPGARGQIFNVGNPANDITVRELADLMRSIFEELTGEPPRSELREISGPGFYGEGYEDMDRARPDISKLRSLGWDPRFDLHTTFRDAMAAYFGPEPG